MKDIYINQGIKSVEEYVQVRWKEEEEERREGETKPDKSEELEKETLEWRSLLECSIAGCDNLNELSLPFYKEYRRLEGSDVEIGKGYQSILKVMANKLCSNAILFNHLVKLIDWSGGEKEKGLAPVKIICENGQVFEADHVIITVSLGVLKESHQNLFNPPLPLEKVDSIQKMGYGTVNKIFLEFGQDVKVRNLGSLQVLSNYFKFETHPLFPRWVRKIFSFTVVSSNSLLAWLTGDEAKLIESISDEEIKDSISTLLSKLYNQHVPKPQRVIKSLWYGDVLFRGSYSYISVHSTPSDISSLSSPICDLHHVPRVLFAGEATHHCYFSTTHGAFFSGEREANRLLSILKNHQ